MRRKYPNGLTLVKDGLLLDDPVDHKMQPAEPVDANMEESACLGQDASDNIHLPSPLIESFDEITKAGDVIGELISQKQNEILIK